ncbi:hypothetical protein COCC4DRAFT_155463 [Bipolaris maydis ATCC 48331]|uniref:FAD dependent oxidoreductase domain-containing protein n=2 Tax=Cochliobolus heterostrophus TaxID=5016 RepID=M2T6I3_COCH5|nr:uncharacterized protein COCC4DRAFT_155463 [Bipolaris maydis ATCC 48331]EMD93205.1 hypothetical protein COCHEDRAFT_1096660 [Bipolaris maydis C5]ENH98557.1 hypothetical protein COCC4DRAFT_155463 [Bipolaris maydis ATCC 48331]KAJ6204471.1 hypothetical protein PSV09DRAFT_1096660 [Bipolaris maydis]KAJ6266804.1 hypothetical protein PSV08DRAFT_188221 [Bipolaris maydis]
MVLPVPDPTKSYWIEAADSSLRNFRSSESLPEETDVAIIGSGYAGASTAYWIHKGTENTGRQPKVTVLEARDVCGSATGRNGKRTFKMTERVFNNVKEVNVTRGLVLILL